MREPSNRQVDFRLPLKPEQQIFLNYLAKRGFAREELLWLRRPLPPEYRAGFADYLGWTRSRAWRVMRSLYGVIGINESPYVTFPDGVLGAFADVFVYNSEIRYTNRKIYDSVEVTKSNERAVTRALQTGEFTKPMQVADFDVLQAIYGKTQAMQERYGPNFYPRDTPKELAEEVGKSETAAKAALERLEGLVCRVGWASHHGFKINRFRKGTKRDRYDDGYRLKIQYRPKWIVPKAREGDILEVLDLAQ